MYKLVYKTVTAIMLTVTGIQTVLAAPGLAPQQNDDRVEVQYSTRKLSLTTKPTITKSKDKWWNDFEKSGQKDLVQYVHNLADTNPEAASWFLLTGGKHGFSSRKATMDEGKLLLAVIDKINSTLPHNQEMTEWAKSSEIGQLHFSLIYKRLNQYESRRGKIKDELKEIISASKADKAQLDAKLESYEKKHGVTYRQLMSEIHNGNDYFRQYNVEDIISLFNSANRLDEYQSFSDNLKEGILNIYIATKDKYHAGVKPIDAKYHAGVKLIRDKYLKDKTSWENKEADTMKLWENKEADTMKLWKNKEALQKSISEAPYLDLVDIVNHFYPNSI